IYSYLVKMFFSNLHLTDGILRSEVKRHRITLSVEEFGEMLGLPHEDTIIELRDRLNIYNYIIIASSIMKEPSPSIPYPFTVGYIHPENYMTHYVINYILFPRKRNFDLITKVDMEAIWLMENKVKVN
ncbi:hypothetical protein RYX36_024239, partial [Vicia faba]